MFVSYKLQIGIWSELFGSSIEVWLMKYYFSLKDTDEILIIKTSCANCAIFVAPGYGQALLGKPEIEELDIYKSTAHNRDINIKWAD